MQMMKEGKLAVTPSGTKAGTTGPMRIVVGSNEYGTALPLYHISPSSSQAETLLHEIW